MSEALIIDPEEKWVIDQRDKFPDIGRIFYWSGSRSCWMQAIRKSKTGTLICHEIPLMKKYLEGMVVSISKDRWEDKNNTLHSMIHFLGEPNCPPIPNYVWENTETSNYLKNPRHYTNGELDIPYLLRTRDLKKE